MRRGIWGLICLLGLGIVGGAIIAHFGSIEYALARARGKTLLLTPTELNVGEIRVGEPHDIQFTVANLTGTPLKILGGDSSCGCVQLSDLPIEIPPHEEAKLTVRVGALRKQSEYHQTVTLYADVHGTVPLTAHIRGTAVDSGSLATSH